MSTTTRSIDSETIVKQYHSDLLAFLKAHYEEASQDESAATDNAGFVMIRLRDHLSEHIKELEAAGEARFGDPEVGKRLKEILAKATGWTFGILSGMGSHGTSKRLRNEYVFLNAVSVGYSMLYTTEVGANGESDYARLLLKHLREWNDLIVSFNRSLPSVVLDELSEEESGFDKSRAIEITRRLQETWSEHSDTATAGTGAARKSSAT